MVTSRFDTAIGLFDAYNSKDPKKETIEGEHIPGALVYAWRMSNKLDEYQPSASESLRLAARCQHIGRWEIPRQDYPMDRKGYLLWRSRLKKYHADIAADLMDDAGYEADSISKVKDLLLKKQLNQNQDTQVLEDVICLVFLEHYFDDFSSEHEDEKLIGILKKTIAKMSLRGMETALRLPLSDKAKSLIEKAASL